MHHLLAFAGSVANGATNANLPRVTDSVFNNAGSGYVYGTAMKLLKCWAGVLNGTDVRVNSATLRLIGPQQVWPFDVAASPSSIPPIVNWDEAGPLIAGNDFFNIEVSRGGAGANNCYGMLILGQGMPMKDKRPSRTVIATSTTTIADGVWTAGTMTFTTQLPPGRYAITGAMGYGTNLLFTRFIFPGALLRPGYLAQQAVSEWSQDEFRYGNLGNWGEFDNESPPTVEMMGIGAGASQTHILELVQLSGR